MRERYPDMFIWPSRCLENELLSPRILKATLARAGKTATEEEIAQRLKQIAGEQKDQILDTLIQNRLIADYDLPEDDTPHGLLRVEKYLRESLQIAQDKLTAFPTVSAEVAEQLEARWERDWPSIMDGKKALGEYVRFTPFDKKASLINAIISTARDDHTLMSTGLTELRARLNDMGMSSRNDSDAAEPRSV
jgi:hypothetical protein